MPHPNDPLSELGAELDAQLDWLTSVEPRLRRFRRAARDLGLPVPAAWVDHRDPATARFADLTAAQFDRLVILLEDLAAERTGAGGGRAGSQRRRVVAPAGPAPTPTHQTSNVHMVVPR